jgi:cyclic nucleotide-binding protein
MAAMDLSRLARAIGVRPGEGRLVAGVAALFALLEGARGFGEVGAEAQVLAHFGPSALPTTLPYLFIALGAVSLAVALGYAVGLARLPRVPLFVGILATVAVLLIGQRIALAAGAGGIVPLLWLTVFAASSISFTLAWTVAGATFDARQAKRLFPLLTGAAIAGSFTGTLASGAVARLTGVESLVVVQAVLLLLAAGLLWRLPRPRPRATAIASSSVVDNLRVGFDTVMRSPLMRLVALAYVLLAVLMFSVSYPFLIAASKAFPDQVELATALGLLSTAVTASSFVASVVVANRLYARFGVAVGALALPLVYVAGFGLWIIVFTFATAAVVRFGQQVAQRGVSNAAWSAFYNVIPVDRRAQVLAFNDGVPGQVGTMLSGVLLLVTAGLVSLQPVFWLGLVTAVVATAVVIGIRRRYADSLLAALRSGLAEQVLEGAPGAPMLGRPEVRAALSAAIEAPDPGTRRIGVAYLRRIAPLSATELERLEALVEDTDPGVRAEVALTLAASAAGSAEDPRPPAIITALLDSADERDHIAGLTAAAQLPGAVTASALAPALGSSSPAVRAAAIGAAVAHPEGAAVAPTPALIEALDDDAAAVRLASAAALRNRGDAAHPLVDVLRNGTPRAQDAALAAIPGHAAAVREDLLAWANGQIEHAESLHRARAAVVALPQRTDDRDFLEAVIGQRIRRAEDRAIASLVAIGAPAAGGLMRRSLRSADPDARAQAIEALDSLGDRRLGHALTACLEAAVEGPSDTSLAMLERLGQDDDGWIRTLSRRILDAEKTDDETEGSMAGQDGVATEIDTMLLLRRIPLFAGLDPEDLERIAMVTADREWAEGEKLIEEGDVGDSVVVLTEGTVRVVHVDPGGEERFIRTYEAGDHIGELAVLRERPRAATVIAQDGGVRGLVLGGDGLRAILRERPEAAMAMLATLAERITRQ